MAEQSYNLKYTGKEIDDLLDKANDINSSAQVPTGGISGQVLTKKSGTDYDADWKTPGVSLPAGGTAGQILTKNSSTNGDASWKTPATPNNPLPTGGTTGQVLAKSSNTDFDVTWADQTGGGSGDSNVVIAVYENNTLSKTYDELLAAINANKIVYVMVPGNTYTRYYSYQYTRSDYGLVFTSPPKVIKSPDTIRIPFFAVKSDNTIAEDLSFVAGAVPQGGSTGQVLRKKSMTSYATEWVNADVSLIASANAGAHNAIYRGNYLGTSVTTEQYAAISAGTFDDLYIGDYWTIGGVNYRIAAFDYYLNSGDTNCTTHHVVIVPDTCLYNAAMNSTGTTNGGYIGSAMRKSNLEQAKSTIKTAFGTAHILTKREFLTNAVNNGMPSVGAWVDSDVDLMNEVQVYGSVAWGAHNGNGHNVASGSGQFPLLMLDRTKMNIQKSYWLRDVSSGSNFSMVAVDGVAGYGNASKSLGVRPAFCIY